MRHYETLYIINPDLPDEDIEAVVVKFRGLLEEHGATMITVDDWGRRRLAYEVKKFHKGYYVLFEYGASPEAVAEMERNFKIDDRVIRFLTVLIAKDFDIEALLEKQEAERARKAAAKAAAETSDEDDDDDDRHHFDDDDDDDDEDDDDDDDDEDEED